MIRKPPHITESQGDSPGIIIKPSTESEAGLHPLPEAPENAGQRAGPHDPLAPTESQYYDLIESAAILQREFLGVNQAEKYLGINQTEEEDLITKERGRVYYVFDTDVFTSYGNSLLTGPLAGRSRNGYGQLMPRRYTIPSLSLLENAEDRRKVKAARFWEDRDAAIVARELARAALEDGKTSLGDGEVLLQLDSHFDETGSMLAAIRHHIEDIDTDKAEKQREALRKNVVKAFKALQAKDDIAENLSVEKFLGFFLGEIMRREMQSEIGPLYEAAKYKDLKIWKDQGEFDTGRMKLSEFTESGSKRDLFYAYPRENYKDAREVLSSLWDDLLKDANKNDDNHKKDVAALTELTIVNRYLQDNAETGGGEEARVILITGDISLLKACYRAPKALERNLEQYVARVFEDKGRYNRLCALEWFFGLGQSNSRWFDRFALHYVRHIRAYSRKVLFEDGDEQASHRDLGDFFDGLFADEARALQRSRRELEKLAIFPRSKSKPADFRKQFSEALDKWNDMVARALGKKRLDFWNENNLSQKDMKVIQEITSRIVCGQATGNECENASDWLLEYVDRVRDDTMIALSGLGAGTLEHAEVTYPPDLYFDTLENCQKVFEGLATKPGYLKDPELLRDFENIHKDCYPEGADKSDNRWENHLRFVVLGAVFASAQKWSVAAGHALRAIAIIERAKKLGKGAQIPTKQEKSNPSGREAYFLSSICKRIRARNDEELVAAEGDLEKAEAAFENDLEKNPEHPLGEVRFLNERFSIALARYYQARLELENEKGRNASEQTGNNDEISDASRSHVSDGGGETRICERCTELDEAWRELSSDKDLDSYLDKYATFPRQLTGMYTALNILQLATISAFWKEREPSDASNSERKWREEMAKLEFPSEQCVQAALGVLNSANSENEPLRSTKMGMAYEIAGRLVLGWEAPERFPDRQSVADLFDELQKEVRAEYDKWRVRNLKDFVLSKFEEKER